jgi:hypothetical protein
VTRLRRSAALSSGRTRGAESHPKRPVPKVEMRVVVVDHNGAPGRTHILPQGNESRMKKYVHLADAAFPAGR